VLPEHVCDLLRAVVRPPAPAQVCDLTQSNFFCWQCIGDHSGHHRDARRLAALANGRLLNRRGLSNMLSGISYVAKGGFEADADASPKVKKAKTKKDKDRKVTKVRGCFASRTTQQGAHC
jgi:hypothetical protein